MSRTNQHGRTEWATDEEWRVAQVRERERDEWFERFFLLTYIALYTVSFICFMAAIWGVGWRSTATGLVICVVAVVVNCIWGVKYRGWD